MRDQSPLTTLDARYSEENAKATPWPDAASVLEEAVQGLGFGKAPFSHTRWDFKA
jgi:hypothetical protein